MSTMKKNLFSVKRTIRFSAIVLTALLVLTGRPLFFASSAQADEEDSTLAREMKGMNRDFRQLKQELSDPSKKSESLALVDSMKKHALASRDLDPANAKKIPEAERGKWIADYQKEIDRLVGVYDKLHASIASDKPDDAKKILDEVMSVKREGHREFAKEDDSHGPHGPHGPDGHDGPPPPPGPDGNGPDGPHPTP